MLCGDTPRKTLSHITGALCAALALSLACPGAAVAEDGVKMRQIEHKEFSSDIVSHTSEASREGGTYSTRALWDGRTWTAWGCDDPKDAWIEITFPVPRYVARIELLTGDGASANAWRTTRRPRALRIVHDHGEQQVGLDDSMSIQTLSFPEAIVTARLRIHIDGVYGKIQGPVAISTLKFFEPEDVFALKPDLRQEIMASIEAMRSPRTREGAMVRLQDMGTPARPWILTALKDQDPKLRAAATELLRRTGAREGIDPVHDAARKIAATKAAASDPEERAFMRAALTYLGEQHAVRGARLARKMFKQNTWRTAMELELVTSLAKSGLPDSASVLTEAMGSEDASLVAVAIPAFARIGQAGVNGLNSLSKHKDPAVRIRVAQALAHYERTRPTHLVRRMLEDEDYRVRAQMVRSLGENPRSEWVPHVLKYVEDEHDVVRRAAALTLGRFPQARAGEVLEKMATDRSTKVRSAVVRALEMHGEQSLARLVRLAPPSASVHDDVTLGVEKAIARMASRNEAMLVELLSAPLDSAEPADGQHLAYLLASCGSAGANNLLDMMKGHNTRLAFYAMRALQSRPEHALSAVKGHIDTKGFTKMDPSLAARYLQILSATGDPAWIPTIAMAMEDRRNYLRAESMRALSSFHTQEAHQHMIEGLSDPWEDVRFEAANALGAHKVRTAVPALLDMIKRRDIKMLRAIRALGEIGDTAALPTLYDLLDHERSTVRQYTCTAIGEIGRPESLSHLLKVINDKDELVAFYARRAMKRIN